MASTSRGTQGTSAASAHIMSQLDASNKPPPSNKSEEWGRKGEGHSQLGSSDKGKGIYTGSHLMSQLGWDRK